MCEKCKCKNQETLARLEKIESERPKPKSLIQKIKENTNFLLDIDECNKLRRDYNSMCVSLFEANKQEKLYTEKYNSYSERYKSFLDKKSLYCSKEIEFMINRISELSNDVSKTSGIIENTIKPELEKLTNQMKQMTEILPDVCLLDNILDKVKNFKELIIAFDYQEDRWQNTFFLINKRDRFVVKELMLNSEDKEDTNINNFIENALSITLKKYETELIRRGMLKEENEEKPTLENKHEINKDESYCKIIDKIRQSVLDRIENKIYQTFGTDKRSVDIDMFIITKLEENGIDPEVHNEELYSYIKNNFKLEKYEIDGKVIEVIKFKDLDFLKL